MDIDMNFNASFTLVALGVCGVLAVCASRCSFDNRYVDCKKVCEPRNVLVQDSKDGRCECMAQKEN